MAIAHCTTALFGWATGYHCSTRSHAENKAREEKNPLLSSRILTYQFNQLTHLACSLTARVKPAVYGRVYTWSSVAVFLSIPLFMCVSGRIGEYAGKFLYAAIVTASVALIYFGAPAYGGAFLGAIVYRELEAREVVPENIQRLIKQCMPVVSVLGMMFGNGWFNRFYVADLLAHYCFPNLDAFILNKFDYFHRWAYEIGGRPLEDFYAPWVQRKDLTFDEINVILSNQVLTGLNPAHCSKWVPDEVPGYEGKLLKALQEDRKWIINKIYERHRDEFDVRYLEIGFYPTPRNSFDAMDIMLMNGLANDARQHMFFSYDCRMPIVMEKLGSCRDCVGEILDRNPHLSGGQKNQMMHQTDADLSKLLLVMLGVYRSLNDDCTS